MWIPFGTLHPDQVYFTLTQALVPRPIAWVLSENADGGLNLAPFSYFTAISSDPPLLLISTSRKPSGEPKDTRVNIEARDDFVVMIPHRELLEAMNASSATLPAGVSEVERLGLDTVPFEGSRLPRLAGCRLAFACRRYQSRRSATALRPDLRPRGRRVAGRCHRGAGSQGPAQGARRPSGSRRAPWRGGVRVPRRDPTLGAP